MRAPVDLPTRETASFVMSHLPAGVSLLEIGCGEGHLAGHLRDAGYRVIGLESDLERARLTFARGVPSALAAWPRFESLPFDAIAFTRSLHHIDPLPESVLQANALLKPGGVLLLEDFAVDEVTPTDLEWFRGVVRSRTARALFVPAPDELVSQLLDAENPFALWSERHDHVHPFARIESEVREAFTIGQVSMVPYFYRYLVYVLPPFSDAGAAFIETVFDEESRLVAKGAIVGLGRRIVGSPLRRS